MFGYVTMRNQDGTQWASIRFGNIQWEESKRHATPIHKSVFDVMEANVENTRKNDCPDNGFYGVYNLVFHPLKK